MLPPPQFLFMHVNKRCNLRCQHCDFWKLETVTSTIWKAALPLGRA